MERTHCNDYWRNKNLSQFSDKTPRHAPQILICLFKHHGDVLLSAPLYFALKKGFPNAEVTVCLYRETAPMLEGHPAIDTFLLYDRSKKSWGYDLRFWFALRRRKFDIAITLTEGDRGILACRISGAPVRIGMGTFHKCWMEHLLTHRVQPTHTVRHTVERYLDTARLLGVFPACDERDLFFHIPEELKTHWRQKLPEHYIHIHPVSRLAFKCWNVEKLARLIDMLHKRGEQVVLTASGALDEMAYIIRVKEAMETKAEVIDLSGQLSLKELGAIIALSKCLLCVDTVALHMASALKHPTVALFGPSSEERWAPWQNPYARVITTPLSCRPCYNAGCGGSGKSDCLERISTDIVLETLTHLMDRTCEFPGESP